MDFLNKLAKQLNLGEIKGEPEQVAGGLTHRMFKIFTDKGKYIIKMLNPNIMKRPTAIMNYNKADYYEELLKQNNIKAVYSLIFNNKKMQELDGQYFYVYEWYDGKILKDEEISKYHCKEMGKILAKIHNINLINKEEQGNDKKHIDFKYYLDISNEKNL